MDKKKEKSKKERAKKYDEKLSVEGTLDDVLKISVDKPRKSKKK